MSSSLKIAAASLFALTLVACGENRRPPSGECNENADCTDPNLPVCNLGTSSCVECTGDNDCGDPNDPTSCHLVCQNNACVALAATNEAQTNNAHGNWTGRPGQANYSFEGFCAGDNDCKFGESCNPLTGGCVDASSLLPCQGQRKECAAGFTCLAVDGQNTCFPAALCESNRNCCGRPDFVCDPGQNLCLFQDPECTPPASVVSECPFSPREQGDCPMGRFCSPLGRCVQCVCDGDCQASSGLPRCYSATGQCVSETYCQVPSDCEAGQACDTLNHECVDPCDENSDCNTAVEYCDTTDQVCRSLQNLPCSADDFEPNDTRTEAMTSGSALPIPAAGSDTTLEELSICSGEDYDWYALPVVRGDRLQISGSSSLGLRADLRALAPDGETQIDTGRIAETGNELIDFTANFDGTFWLSVEADTARVGPYRLGISWLTGTPCADAFEETNGANNAIDAGTVLNPETPDPAPTGCTVTGTTGADQTVSCGGSALRICLGEADYYYVDVPPGSDLEVNITGSQGDIDAKLYGPFLDGETIDTSRIAASSGASGTDETLEDTSRTGGRYVIYIFRYSGSDPRYSMDVAIDVGPTCTEDVYDAESATPPAFDVSGFNDVPMFKSGVALTSGAPTTLNLTMCRGDRDWFQAGVDMSSMLANVPAGQELVVEVLNVSSGDNTQLNVFGATTVAAIDDLVSGTSTGAQRVAFRPTVSSPYYIGVRADTESIGPLNYQLRFSLTPAPVCNPDTLGDSTGGNASPAAAFLLAAPPWPDATGESYSQAGVTSCIDDDDWLRIVVPANAEVIATLSYDPNSSDLGFAIYDSTVSAVTPTLGTPPGTGLVDISELGLSGFQWVRAPVSGSAYMMVYNVGNWPTTYTLDVDIVPRTAGSPCFTDSFEPNNTGETAVALPFAPTAEIGVERAFVGPMSLCGTAPTGDDWFKVPLKPGDRVVSLVYENPSEGDIDFELLAPAPGGLNDSALDSDFSSFGDEHEALIIDYTLSETEAPGDYLLHLAPYSFSGTNNNNLYFMDVMIDRACIEDSLEPSSAMTPRSFSWNALPGEQPLSLCVDTDWYAITDVPSGQTFQVCLEFEHDNGDIDVFVYNNPTSTNVLASSTSKVDYESLVYTVSAAGTYYVKVATDALSGPRNTTYRMALRQGSGTCPTP